MFALRPGLLALFAATGIVLALGSRWLMFFFVLSINTVISSSSTNVSTPHHLVFQNVRSAFNPPPIIIRHRRTSLALLLLNLHRFPRSHLKYAPVVESRFSLEKCDFSACDVPPCTPLPPCRRGSLIRDLRIVTSYCDLRILSYCAESLTE